MATKSPNGDRCRIFNKSIGKHEVSVPPPVIPKVRCRIHNRSIGNHEAAVLQVLAKATHDMHVVLQLDEERVLCEQIRVFRERRIQERCISRNEHERQLAFKTQLYYWKRFTEQLSRIAASHLQQYRGRAKSWHAHKTRFAPIFQSFVAMVRRLLRRERETVIQRFVLGLISPFLHANGQPNLMFNMIPVEWPGRHRTCISCPVCVMEYFSGVNRTSRSKPFFFKRCLSRPCSISIHVHSHHTNGLLKRACIACDHGLGLRRSHETSLLCHQLVKHFKFDQHVARHLSHVICDGVKNNFPFHSIKSVIYIQRFFWTKRNRCRLTDFRLLSPAVLGDRLLNRIASYLGRPSVSPCVIAKNKIMT